MQVFLKYPPFPVFAASAGVGGTAAAIYDCPLRLSCDADHHQEAGMNEAIHQLLQLILQGFTWVLRTVEMLWVWSWAQIAGAFSVAWGDLPGWKIALGLTGLGVLSALLVILFLRGWWAFRRIAIAFWTMAVTMFGILTYVVLAGLFSRGFQWVVASTPNTF
jgi:hypothetical protein